MILGISKLFIPLTIKTVSITKQNTAFIRITNTFYPNSAFFLHFKLYKTVTRNRDMETKQSEHYENELIKSENDSMEYRLIKLDNGLKAILVSDVENIINLDAMASNTDESEDSEDEDVTDEENETATDSEEDDSGAKCSAKESSEKMAACALCIGVGSFSDPPEIPGLAHFLEHMVFMGSSKYPQENGFHEFIWKHGGFDNGATDCETTTFHFECNEKHLKEGMDRFAQFFISPLMKRDAMTRERESIHSEFEMSLLVDECRKTQILGSFAPSGHPAANFMWGNLTTLRDNVDDDTLYKEVHEFRKRHYSAHRMTVAVQARLPLDTLEEYVRTSFSDIPNNNLPPDNFSNFLDSFGEIQSFNKIVWIKPVADICQVELTWVLPPLLHEYKSMPMHYLAWLIGHEGEGSLLSLLKKKIWALECTAGCEESGFEYNSIYSLFSISLTLTNEGYKNVEKVISLIFSYLFMLRKYCPSKKIYDEVHTILDTSFRFKAESPAADYVQLLAESMHFYKPEHYIIGGELFLEYKPELIVQVLNLLRSDRVNVIVYSKENSDDFYDRTEPWFGTKYKVQVIPLEWRNMWQNCSIEEEFHIPDPNPYLTTDFSLLKEPEINPPYPIKILNSSLVELWYRQDVKFKKPVAFFSFYITSPIMSNNPLNASLLDMLCHYLETKFKEKLYPAYDAGLCCDFHLTDFGMVLSFVGYNEKLPLLFEEVLKLMRSYCDNIDCSDTEIFKAVKEVRSRHLYSTFLKPRKLAKFARLSLMLDQSCTAIEIYNSLKAVTLENLKDLAKSFWSSIKIYGLIQGNVTEEKSLELCNKFQTILLCSPASEKRAKVRVAKLPKGELFLRLKSFNTGDSNSTVVNYYQVCETNIRTICLIDLLMLIMNEPLFDNLRTKQQMGYDVDCRFRDTFGILGFTVSVFFQSHKFSPDEVDRRIEEFLKSFIKHLKSMPKSEWEEAKKSLISLNNNSDLRLEVEVNRNFAEIHSGEYQFDKLKKQNEIIPEITHKEFCKWYAEHIASGNNFKKLSVQIVGSNAVKKIAETPIERSNEIKLTPMKGKVQKGNLFITDIEEFKKERKFYHLKKQ